VAKRYQKPAEMLPILGTCQPDPGALIAKLGARLAAEHA
jgi:hypothetical protein